MSNGEPLASRLQEAMLRANKTVDQIAEKTKVPRSTLRVLLGDTSAALLPSRVYLRGHLRLIAKEVGLEEAEMQKLFDEAFPDNTIPMETNDLPDRPKVAPVAIAAGLAGVGVLAVIISIFS